MNSTSQIVDKCSVCQEDAYPPYAWLERLFGELPTSLYSNASCIHRMHLVCARQWYSSKNEGSTNCPLCTIGLVNIITLKEAYVETTHKVITLAIFFFGAILGGIIANYLFTGYIFLSIAGMGAGWYLAKNAAENPQVQAHLSSVAHAYKYAYCLYYGLDIKDV